MSIKSVVTVTQGSWAALAVHALPVRLAVFVQEQAVPLEMEVDEWDPVARHVVLFDAAGDARATGRLYRATLASKPVWAHSESIGHIGRVAVLAAYRGQGHGALVMHALIEAANEQGLACLTLHAQCVATGFYEKFGFRGVGEAFEEAGIPHIEMSRHTAPG